MRACWRLPLLERVIFYLRVIWLLDELGEGHFMPQIASKQIPNTNVAEVAARPQTPWQERSLLPLRMAGEIAGISPASIYRLADEGRISLRRLAGRTLVQTRSLVALLDQAEPWTANDRGKEARAKRKEIARAALQD